MPFAKTGGGGYLFVSLDAGILVREVGSDLTREPRAIGYLASGSDYRNTGIKVSTTAADGTCVYFGGTSKLEEPRLQNGDSPGVGLFRRCFHVKP